MTDAQARQRAMQLTAQLPVNPEQSRKVLAYMLDLARFVAGDDVEKPSEAGK